MPQPDPKALGKTVCGLKRSPPLVERMSCKSNRSMISSSDSPVEGDFMNGLARCRRLPKWLCQAQTSAAASFIVCGRTPDCLPLRVKTYCILSPRPRGEHALGESRCREASRRKVDNQPNLADCKSADRRLGTIEYGCRHRFLVLLFCGRKARSIGHHPPTSAYPPMCDRRYRMARRPAKQARRGGFVNIGVWSDYEPLVSRFGPAPRRQCQSRNFSWHGEYRRVLSNGESAACNSFVTASARGLPG